MRKEITLPEISENVTSGTVFSILVEQGEEVEADQPLLELESEKATVEVPSPYAGTIREIFVGEGDTAEVGQSIMVIETREEGSAESAETAETEESAETGGSGEAAEQPGGDTASAESAAAAENKAAEQPGEDTASAESAAAAKNKAAAPSGGERESRAAAQSGARVPASPAVRRFARELGVDITAVRGSGPHGRIAREDVQAHVKSAMQFGSAAANAPAPGGQGAVAPQEQPLPDFTQWGEVEREAFSSIRRATADGTARSWQAVPHVTHTDKADITELEEFRSRYRREAERRSVKLTLTAILVKVAAAALQRHPKLNASIDMQRGEIIYKRYVHIGVAVDTPRGLLMPVIRNVPEKGIIKIAGELETLAEKAKNGRLSPEEMSGGSFAISNLGGIGGTSFTPIVYWPQSAILGVSAAAVEPLWQDGQWIPRTMLPLSLSYDHRLIDGADGARFLRWTAEALQYPLLMQLEGGDNE